MNLWTKSNTELAELAEKYQMEFDAKNTDRKEFIPMLAKKIADAGDLEAPVMHDDEGNQLQVEPEEKTFVVKFFQQDGHPNYVFLGHQGAGLYLPREVKWRLPIRFMSVLNESVVLKVVPDVDNQGRTKGVKVIKQPALSYQIFPE